MTPDKFVIESERTERKFPEGMEVGIIDSMSIRKMIHATMMVGETTGLLKKQIIYGASRAAQYGESFAKMAKKAEEILDDRSSLSLDSMQAEVLHALLGKISELGELVEILAPYILGEKILTDDDILHLSEELGDQHWYDAILMRTFGLKDGKIRHRNIEKLRVRYPEAFDADKALNRDLEAEQVELRN